MKNLKYIFVLLILAAVSCTTPLTEEEKNSDSVLLKQVHEYTLNEDGSVDYHYYHRRLYNTYMSFHRLYGETFVIYNPDYQTLTVNKSQTTMADGKKVQSPDNAFNESLPFSAANAPAYNHLREMVITHVGLEIGAVVELDYTIHTKAGFLPVFSGNLLLNESSPIKKLEVIVRLPKSQELNHSFLNKTNDVVFEEGKQGRYQTYSWTSINLRARSNEPHQAEGFANYSWLQFSNANLSEVMEVMKSNLSKPFEVQESMRKLLDSKQKGWELVGEIRNHVVNNMNTYRVDHKNVGYRFRTPNQVWESNGGTEGEKAILLASLLNEAGFNAEVVLAAYPHLLNKEVGCPDVFDSYMVRVNCSEESKNFSLASRGEDLEKTRILVGLNCDIDSLEIDEIVKPNLVLEMKSAFAISMQGKVSGNATLQFNEFDGEQGLLHGISPSSFTSKEEQSNDTLTVYSVELGKDFEAKKFDGYMEVELPTIAQGVASASLHELPSKRVARLELPASFDERYEYQVSLADGLSFVTPASNLQVENAVGNLSVVFEVTDGKLKVKKHLKLNQSIFPESQYSDFRELLNIWSDKNYSKVIVKTE
ncbi:MAG TPA: DUF3857 domain-containing protein [Tenuifilaceae bacterium]|nr:DUF3857 domain-containing protein [Tenuifilaceae bacterium]